MEQQFENAPLVGPATPIIAPPAQPENLSSPATRETPCRPARRKRSSPGTPGSAPVAGEAGKRSRRRAGSPWRKERGWRWRPGVRGAGGALARWGRVGDPLWALLDPRSGSAPGLGRPPAGPPRLPAASCPPGTRRGAGPALGEDCRRRGLPGRKDLRAAGLPRGAISACVPSKLARHGFSAVSPLRAISKSFR